MAVIGSALLFTGLGVDNSLLSQAERVVYKYVAMGTGLILLSLSGMSVILLAAIDSAADDLGEQLSGGGSSSDVNTSADEIPKAQ